MSTVLVLSCILTSGSISFAGSARAAVVEHAFTRTKVRCRSLLTRNSVAGDSASAVSAWSVVHKTSESVEGGLKWEEVYQKQGPLPAGGLRGALVPGLCQGSLCQLWCLCRSLRDCKLCSALL